MDLLKTSASSSTYSSQSKVKVQVNMASADFFSEPSRSNLPCCKVFEVEDRKCDMATLIALSESRSLLES